MTVVDGKVDDAAQPGGAPALARRITLPLLILYGVGVTVGAGIYVLIGAASARAGIHAPLAFLVAAVLIGFSAASYAELSARLPVSAGAAAYVQAGFGSRALTLTVGLLVASTGIISSAALVRGGAGYLGTLVSLPDGIVMIGLVLAIGAVAAWGIGQSVITAAIFTCLEVGGLLIVIAAGLAKPGLLIETGVAALAVSDISALFGISSAVLLAFYAFIGFEDMANVAEETVSPERTMPVAIAVTLVATTVLYCLVSLVALANVPIAELAASKAPLALVFERTVGISGSLIAAIAVAAVLNGALINVIMGSRVLYGLSRMGSLPAILGTVHSVTRTPLVATALVTAAILVLCLGFDVAPLAELVSSLTLLVFALVNLALWTLKSRDTHPPAGFSVPRWVPLVGFVISLGFLVAELGRRLL